MGKLLSWVLLIALAWLVFKMLVIGQRKLARARRAPPASGAESPAPPRGGDPERIEAIVACAHCGVHVPVSQSIDAAGRAFCCAEHRDAGPA